MSAFAFRKFAEEIVTMVGRRVAVETSGGNNYEGNMLGIDENLSIIIETARAEDSKVFKVAINGAFVREIKLIEKPFDLKALASRVERVFPGLVRMREDIGAIVVMDKIKVTEQGVAEGGGLAAERVKTVYDEFVKQSKA